MAREHLVTLPLGQGNAKVTLEMVGGEGDVQWEATVQTLDREENLVVKATGQMVDGKLVTEMWKWSLSNDLASDIMKACGKDAWADDKEIEELGDVLEQIFKTEMERPFHK